MILPTRPHAIFSTLQGTQNPDTKPTLQRAKNADAQPTHPSGRNSYRLQQNTSANNNTQHQSPPTTQGLKNYHFWLNHKLIGLGILSSKPYLYWVALYLLFVLTQKVTKRSRLHKKS
jgi:hypothetical protein